MGGDLFQAYLERSFFFFVVFLHPLQVFRCCHAYQLFKRLDKFIFADLTVFHCNFTAFDTAGRFHNYFAALFELLAVRVEIIYLTNIFKTDANDFCHLVLHDFPFTGRLNSAGRHSKQQTAARCLHFAPMHCAPSPSLLPCASGSGA